MGKNESKVDSIVPEDDETLADQAGSQSDEEAVSSEETSGANALADALSHHEDGGDADATAGTEGDDAKTPDLSAEVDTLKDQLLRKQADFENFRRRLHRDKAEAIRYANTEVLLDLAEVIDGLERAVQSGAEADAAAVRDGVSLIEKQLTGMLERKWGFCRFSSEGEPFDPEKHQAIVSEESEEHEVATVIEDYQRGYLLHDRVVRPARVKVAQPIAVGGDDSVSSEDAESAHTKEGA